MWSIGQAATARFSVAARPSLGGAPPRDTKVEEAIAAAFGEPFREAASGTYFSPDIHAASLKQISP